MSAPRLMTHLVTADDVLIDGSRCGTYLALCGVLLPTDSLPVSWCPEGCACDPTAQYCPQCVRQAAEGIAEAEQLGHAPHQQPSVQSDHGEPVGSVLSASGPHGINADTTNPVAGPGRG
ncbi:MAG: hypothetical protein ACRDTC_29040 [Pseudonocardiaceae bacterium]